MNSQATALEQMNAALQRLEQAVDSKLALTQGDQTDSASDSLLAEIARLKEENSQLREMNQNSAKKLDLAIDRMNNMINAS